MAPGITPYGPWRKESYENGQGPWQMAWAFKSIYPANVTDWPGHERWFGNYTCPMNAEFTIHQNTIFNAVTFGFLCDTVSGVYAANQRPVMNKLTIKKTNAGGTTDDLILEAMVSDPDADGRIYKVEFFDSWHKIGEAFEAPYRINWQCPATRDFSITAKVWDELGATGKSTIVKRDAIITSSSQPLKDNYRLSVYPNPTSKEFNFRYQQIENKAIELSIYNTQGKLMKKLEYNPGASSSVLLTWNPEKHHAREGVYLYHSVITCGKEIVEENGKIVYNKN
jgi:hypothetical protein